VPSIVDHEEEMWQNDYPMIRKWVDSKQDEFGFEIEHDTGKNIILTVDVRRFEEMISDLFDHKIVSDYDAKELRRATKRRG